MPNHGTTTRTPRVATFASSDADRAQQRAIFERNSALVAQFGDDRRGNYSAMCSLTPLANGIDLARVSEQGIDGWWVTPPTADRSHAIFFVHGGGYHLGDATSYRGFASQIAARMGCAVFAVDYPLAPEQRFPSAYDAVQRAFEWFTTRDVAAYALMGDSAGGGLALALLADVRTACRPACVAVFSPWTDLALSGRSFNDPSTFDPVFKPEVLAGLAKSYLNDADPRDPRASPLYGIPEAPPPLLLQVGTDEVLLDDARRYADGAAVQGGKVELQLFDGMHHVFQRDVGHLDTAGRALDKVADFVARHWS